MPQLPTRATLYLILLSGLPFGCRTPLEWEPVGLGDLGAVPDFQTVPPDDSVAPPDLVVVGDISGTPDFSQPLDFTVLPPPNDLLLPDFSLPRDFALPVDQIVPPDFVAPPDFVLPPDLRLPPPSCTDGIKNGFETDVDCGGGSCPTCGAGHRCGIGSDCISTLCPATICRGKLGFFSPTELDVNSSPFALAAGDFNRDGNPDLVAADFSSSFVAVLTGKGDGTFKPFALYSAGSQPLSITAADLNADGNLDLVMTNGTSSVMRVLGDGKGSFGAAAVYPAGSHPVYASTGDFDGDGHPDVLAADNGVMGQDPGGVSLLLARADGSLQSAVFYKAGSYPTGAATGDFNGDGQLDAVVPNLVWPGFVVALFGSGAGTLSSPLSFTAGGNADAVETADFDGDKALDLAVVNGGTEDVSILRGYGNGTFHSHLEYKSGKVPVAIAVSDFDLDGNRDLVVLNNLGMQNTVSVLLGRSDGTFDAPVAFTAGGGQGNVVVADVNVDGKPDIAVVNRYNNSLTVLLNSAK